MFRKLYSSKTYNKNPLLNLNKTHKLVPEVLVQELKLNPTKIYKMFYHNQYKMLSNFTVFIKIIADINTRLEPNSILHLEQFTNAKEELISIRDKLITYSPDTCIDPKKMYDTILKYTEVMYELIKTGDDTFDSDYHTQFTKGFMDIFMKIGNNTQLFFTFKEVNPDYLINIRPACIYLNWLVDIPDFIVNKDTYKPNVNLVPIESTKRSIEGNVLDFREVTYHDLGHSYVMSRQDTWLFDTINRSPPELVNEWTRNKNWYCDEINKISNKQFQEAVKLYLFDIVHDRGYQFYLPILLQQFIAKKNLENIKTKIIRGNFKGIIEKDVLEHIDAAQKFLCELTKEFLIKDNLDKINQYNGYIIKSYPNIESHTGIPTDVVFYKDKIMVNFLCNNIIKTASIYEIELLDVSTSKKIILSPDKIDKINKFMNEKVDNFNTICFRIDQNGDIIGTSLYGIEAYENKYNLRGIEIYKLERLLQIMQKKQPVNFSISRLPDIYESDKIHLETDNVILDDVQLGSNIIILENGLAFPISYISIEPKPRLTLKYINLDGNDRFVCQDILRESYIRYEASPNPDAKPYITLSNDLELGVVNTMNNVTIAKAVSSLLSRSVELAKDELGGYLPSDIVMRAQLEYVSPLAISNLWGKSGYRFVLSRSVGHNKREIIGTALVANSKDTLFFFTSRYHNLRHSMIETDLDLSNKWFKRFDFPNVKSYKLPMYNQLANFAVERIDCRGLGLGKLLINSIIKNYSMEYIKKNSVEIEHSQPFICGKGLFQIADPSWLPVMTKIGLQRRLGAESFYIETENEPLPKVKISGKYIDNVSYNNMFQMPQLYSNNVVKEHDDIHLINRIPRVVELSECGYAKLQYFQLFNTFSDFRE